MFNRFVNWYWCKWLGHEWDTAITTEHYLIAYCQRCGKSTWYEDEL